MAEEIYTPSVKGEMEPEIRIVRGDYLNIVRARLLEKFRNEPDPGLLVNKLQKTAEKIFINAERLAQKPSIEHNLLLVGRVQSGKTSNLEMLMGVAFDSGYNCAIVFGGYDSVLLDQTSRRYQRAFAIDSSRHELKGVQLFSTKDSTEIAALDNQLLENIFEVNGKLIITAMKRPNGISKVNDFLQRMKPGLLRAFVIDDEGDQASLNTEWKRNRVSRTYEEIVRMKDLLNNPVYYSVTATPQALLFSPDLSRLLPDRVNLINPGRGYTDLNQYHVLDDHVCLISDEIDEELPKGRIPESLKWAICHFLISSAVMRLRGINQSQMIIHTNTQVKVHAACYDLVYAYVDSFKGAVESGGNNLKRKHVLLKSIYENRLYFSPKLNESLPYENLKAEIEKVIKNAFIILQDTRGKSTMALADYRPYRIHIGADLLQRGVSFDQLVTTYFTRWPRGTGNMDTSVQRARWLGYREKYLDIAKIFTTASIAADFASLAETENDLWDQLEDIENCNGSLRDIVIEKKEDLNLRPARTSVTSTTIGVFGLKWLNQYIGVKVKRDIQNNNSLFNDLIRSKEFVPTSVGRTNDSLPTAYWAEISHEEFYNLWNKTEGIFVNKPFGNLREMQRAIGTKKIIMEIFWNPDTDPLSSPDIRERTFHDIAGGKWRVSALQQGADKSDPNERTYLGDNHVIVDENAVIIQVFPILPKDEYKRLMPEYFQYMYSIHVPRYYSVYMRT